MVILIGGESHTGKTLMAQNLLEKYHFPYTSLDHLKMGLIRGAEHCGFTALDDDCIIAEKLWGIVKGIIQTCIENKQNIILEGCYFPPDKIKEVVGENVIYLYLLFSDHYINKHFPTIIQYENAIEDRRQSDERTREDYRQDNQRLKEKCLANNLTFFEIDNDYQKELIKAYDYIDRSLLKIRPYEKNDITEITQLFYDTVHSINAKDYAKQQLNAWAAGNIDKRAWHQSLADHDSIVAEKNGKIVGFGDLAIDYIDRLYVHKEYQRQGIATAIIDKLEQHAISNGIASLRTHASITARDFFVQRGYSVMKEQRVQRSGISLTNFVMEKILSND